VTALLGAGAAAEAQSPGALPGLPGSLPWPGGWALVGGLAASAHVFMRLLYQGFKAQAPDEGAEATGGERGLSEGIGITGGLVPALAIGYALGGIAWVVAAYAIVYAGGALLVTLKLARRAEREDRAGREGKGSK
jgi:hypothetical protein